MACNQSLLQFIKSLVSQILQATYHQMIWIKLVLWTKVVTLV